MLRFSFLLFFFPSILFSQNTNIHLHLSNVTESKIMLLGKFDFDLPLKIDSVVIDSADTEVVFNVKEKLPTGLYFFYLKGHPPVEFIINGEVKLEFKSSAIDFLDSMESVFSYENAPFFYWQTFRRSREQQIENLKMGINMIRRATKDPAAVSDQVQSIQELYEEIESFTQAQPAKYPNTFFAKYVAAKNFPHVPESISKSKQDGTANPAYLDYFKTHYWDAYDFSEVGLNNTPVFKEKLDTWLSLHEFQLDTLYKSIAQIAKKTKAQPALYQYTMRSILTRYETAEAANADAVFVHLFDTYYAKDKSLAKEAIWQRIEYKANLYRPNLLGNIAPPIELKDFEGNDFSLEKMDGLLTMLYFFSPQCARCREWTPKVLEITKNYLSQGLTVVVVSLDGEESYWKSYVERNALADYWTCVFDKERPSKMEDLYATHQLPNLYFLDKDKKIIAKKIPVERLSEFLENWAKTLK